jgi:hypothetical protein
MLTANGMRILLEQGIMEVDAIQIYNGATDIYIPPICPFQATNGNEVAELSSI